jgi:uncharacterized protein (DUF1810 family)
MTGDGDPYALERFIDAQERSFEVALAEIRSGRKRSHWMWYVFPQIAGLGRSGMSQLYGIRDVAEAKAYLNHPLLGSRLIQCFEAALSIDGQTARRIFGSPDDLKFRSCASLFASVSPRGSVFEQALHKYFAGVPDSRTLEALAAAPVEPPST